MIDLHLVLNSIVFAGIGILVLILSFMLIDRITPHSLWREIIEKHNISVAIVAAAFMLSLAIIIASAIH